MNMMSLVMGLLLIFACTFSLSLGKAANSQRVEKTYQAHMNASRKIRNSYESLCYGRLRSESKEPKETEQEKKSHSKSEQEPHSLNLACARLNLWPLITDGAEKHPDLYETAAKIVRSFYSKSLFPDQPRYEYALLNALIESAHQASSKGNPSYLHLEKLSLKNIGVKPLYTMQTIYYRMLRGTKTTQSEQPYPSLIDCFVLENKKSPICLHHASLEMLSALFGSRTALILYAELQKKETHLTLEHLQDICTQNGTPPFSDEFCTLIDLKSTDSHTSGQKVLVKQEADVCLKQKVFFPS